MPHTAHGGTAKPSCQPRLRRPSADGSGGEGPKRGVVSKISPRGSLALSWAARDMGGACSPELVRLISEALRGSPHRPATSPSAPLLSAPEVGAVDNGARQTHSELNGSVHRHCGEVSGPSAGPRSSFSECWWLLLVHILRDQPEFCTAMLPSPLICTKMWTDFRREGL